MALFNGKTPAERNKLIAAFVLGVIALLSLAYMLFGSSSRSKSPPQQTRKGVTVDSAKSLSGQTAPPAAEVNQSEMPQPIPAGYRPPEAPEAERNIFAFYIPTPTPSPAPVVIPPSPSPSPPLLITRVTPSNVYARTGDFQLEVEGDKFTPSSHVTMDGRDLPTRYINAQQLSATVVASLIASEGARQIAVRTPDGKLFSNTATLNLMLPPAPNYSFIGALIGKRSNDVALLQDKGTKEVFNAQRGDILGGRFRLTSISDREVWLVDTTIHVKHILPFTGDNSAEAGSRLQPQRRPARPAESDDDEP